MVADYNSNSRFKGVLAMVRRHIWLFLIVISISFCIPSAAFAGGSSAEVTHFTGVNLAPEAVRLEVGCAHKNGGSTDDFSYRFICGVGDCNATGFTIGASSPYLVSSGDVESLIVKVSPDMDYTFIAQCIDENSKNVGKVIEFHSLPLGTQLLGKYLRVVVSEDDELLSVANIETKEYNNDNSVFIPTEPDQVGNYTLRVMRNGSSAPLHTVQFNLGNSSDCSLPEDYCFQDGEPKTDICPLAFRKIRALDVPCFSNGARLELLSAGRPGVSFSLAGYCQ